MWNCLTFSLLMGSLLWQGNLFPNCRRCLWAHLDVPCSSPNSFCRNFSFRKCLFIECHPVTKDQRGKDACCIRWQISFCHWSSISQRCTLTLMFCRGLLLFFLRTLFFCWYRGSAKLFFLPRRGLMQAKVSSCIDSVDPSISLLLQQEHFSTEDDLLRCLSWWFSSGNDWSDFVLPWWQCHPMPVDDYSGDSGEDGLKPSEQSLSLLSLSPSWTEA